jgi:Outer membrane protein beta-barrel domain
MKTFLTTMILLSAITFTATAQFKLGGSIGLSSSKAKTDAFSGYDEVLSISKTPITLDAIYSVNKMLSFGSGLWLNAKGIKLNDNYNGGNYKSYAYSINYITLPLYLQVSFQATNKFLISPYLGGFTSFATGGSKVTKEQNSTGTANSNMALDFDKLKWATGDKGLLLGINLEYKLKNASVFLRPAYQSSFTDIDESNYLFKNRLTSFSLGYLVTITKPTVKK